MKKLILICTTIYFIACDNITNKVDKKECSTSIIKECSTSIEEGKRLVTTLGCND
jgi:hypothetical protein